jgi:hypothetical protein
VVQAAQSAAVELTLVQIWTPAAPPERVQSRTSWSIQRQLELAVSSFHVHSCGVSTRQIAVFITPQTGTLTLQSEFPEHARPPHCSRAWLTVPRSGSPAPSPDCSALHCTRQSVSAAVALRRKTNTAGRARNRYLLVFSLLRRRRSEPQRLEPSGRDPF